MQESPQKIQYNPYVADGWRSTRLGPSATWDDGSSQYRSHQYTKVGNMDEVFLTKLAYGILRKACGATMSFTPEEKRRWHEEKLRLEKEQEFRHAAQPLKPFSCIHCGNPFGLAEGVVREDAAICWGCLGD